MIKMQLDMRCCMCGVKNASRSPDMDMTTSGFSGTEEKLSRLSILHKEDNVMNRLRLAALEQNRTSGTHLRSANGRRLILNDNSHSARLFSEVH